MDTLTLNSRLSCISRLVTGITHDLNNVFGAIRSNADIMIARLPADDAPLQSNLDHIRHAVQTGVDLVRRLQVYSGHSRFSMDSVDLHALIARVIGNMHPVLPAGCSVYLAGERPVPSILADADLLQAALDGILANAGDAMEGRPGTITIETAADCTRIRPDSGLVLGTLPRNPSVLVEIRDTGEGMTPEAMAHMFDPFFSTRMRASGLGLAPVVGLALHGRAAVQVLSTRDVGTAVRMALPVFMPGDAS